MSADSAVSIGWDLFKVVFVRIKRVYGYVMSSESYANNLRKEVGNLEYEVARVRDAEEEARNNLRNVHGWVPKFLANAEAALREARVLLGEFEEASKTCCRGTLPDPICRYQFSREAKHKTDDIQKLIQENSNKEISFSGPTLQIVTPPTREDGVFKSRAQMIRDIMDALADNSNRVVGVYGMGGVGKSTLVVDAERRIREEKSFDLVAKADVSENPDIKRIQGEIADTLGLSDIKNKESISGRAELLHSRLEKEEREKKKVLIILDDLWKGLDLKSVGIPCGHDNKAVGCKLLLTSRNRDVLRREMGCDRDFLLGGLQEEEAKELFERIVGDKVHFDEFKPLVDKALHKCAGVPFLILVIAKRFKDAGLPEWEDTLKRIEMSKDKRINDVINKMLQLSYDELEDDVKSTLRLCVAYGVSMPSLENLVRYGLGLGLYREYSSIEDARNRLSSIIRTLQASSLLLENNGGGEGFKIHDLVREFVAFAASRDEPLLVLTDKDKFVTELPNDKLKNCRAICFPYIDTKELPEELDCPELQIFLLFTYNESLQVPDSLFKSMRKLMVLSLTGLTRLPSSFQSLVSLHTLCLHHCMLDDVAILGELRELRVLSFVGSYIKRLPKEIGQLVELKLLDLSYCSQLETIEPGVLGNLIKLEELYMKPSFQRWNYVEQTIPANARLIELNRMEKLRTLHMWVSDPSMLPEDLNLEKLSKYHIGIGYKWYWGEDKGPRTLELGLHPMSGVLRKGCIQSILGKTDNLLLKGLDESEQSICALSRKGFPKLKHLRVRDSPSAHYILQSTSHTNFNTLESLILFDLINLEKVCHRHITSKSFSALKVVRIERCHKMEVLFPLSVARELLQVEEVEVLNCRIVQGIVEADDCGKCEFPRLRVLKLQDLPSIKNFFSVGTAPSSSTPGDPIGTQIAFFNGQQVAFPRLETLDITGLHNLKYMFSPSMVKSLAQLRELRVSDCVKMRAIITEEEGWEMEASETLAFPNLTDLHLQNLESLMCFSCLKCSREVRSQDRVKSCSHALFSQEVAFPILETLEITALDNLKYMFSPSMVKSLAQLRELRVSDCAKTRAIITEEEGWEMEASETLAFPNLTDLHLQNLESLMCFSCLKCSQEARNEDHVKSCSRALFNREVAFPSLETLNIFAVGNIEMIWDKDVYFQHLNTLDVSFCDELSHIFTPTIAGNLVGLTKLSISNCKRLTEVIVDEGGKEGHVVAFKQLKYLELHMLMGFRCFSSSGYTLRFPLLEDVIVVGCLIMELFSKGPIEAPKLDKVQVEKHKMWFWKEDLNVTIQNMFEVMATITGVKNIRLCEYPKLIEKWHSELIPIETSWQLTSLVVDKCPSFINAISSRLMHILYNMRTLQVRDCDSVEEIFDLKGLEGLQSTRSLPSFLTLNLINLPKLRRLWNKDLQGTLCFNSLSSLTFYKCSNLRHAFTPSMARCLANLRWMQIKECSQMEEVIADEEGQESVLKEITFPNLWVVNLECLPNLTSFLSGKNNALDCPCLSYLFIVRCPKMRSLTWQSLVENELDTSSLFTPQVQFPQLRQIVLSHMDNLSKIWTDNPLETLTCEQLWEVEFQNCKRLENVFPHWLATSLNRLGKLRVESCGLEGIVSSGDDTPHSTTAQVLFPGLTSLVLHDMPRLKSFCDNFPTLKWPSLRELRVTHCDKLNMFSFEAIMNKWTQRDHEQDLSNQEARASFERDNPNLERLLLVEKDIQMIQDGKFHDAICAKPKALTLACFHDESAVFPMKFLLERFQKLESLEVFCSSFEDIFPNEGLVDEGEHPVLENLRELKLSKLQNLKRIWSGDYFAVKILQSIKTFEVWDCPGLTILFQATTSFQNLTELVVKNSSGLVHLGTASAVASLAHLENMAIIGCERIKEVVAKDENGEGRVISFRMLRELRLENMASLECFSSATSCILRFRSLIHIHVEECPKMNIFSMGPLHTPELHYVSLFRYEWGWSGGWGEWEGDLNETVRRLSA